MKGDDEMFDDLRRALLQKECNGALIRMAQGDLNALNTVYNRMGRMILSVSLQITGNRADAEDVLQDVMLKLTTAAASYAPETNAVAWILTIAKNLSLNKIKERGRTLPLETFENIADGTDEIEQLHESMTLADALKRLSPEDQLILQLKYGSGLTHKEIAEVMGVSASSVQKHSERAIGKLRRDLNPGKNESRAF